MKEPKLALSSSMLSVSLQHRAVIYSNNIPVVPVTISLLFDLDLTRIQNHYIHFPLPRMYTFGASAMMIQTHRINKAVNFLHSLPLMLMKITEEGKKEKPHRKCSSPALFTLQ